MSKADLRGADLRGADLEGIWWKNTVCPDGTLSDSAEDGCLNHIKLR